MSFGKGLDPFSLTLTRSGGRMILNSLPNNKITRLVQIESICRRNVNVHEKLKFGLGRVETIVGKGENADYQHFPFFSAMFPLAPYFTVV